MLVLIVLLAAWLVFRAIGAAGVHALVSWQDSARYALVVMFIANVNAAQRGVTLRGKPPTPLWLRAPMQLLFIALLWWSTRA